MPKLIIARELFCSPKQQIGSHENLVPQPGWIITPLGQKLPHNKRCLRTAVPTQGSRDELSGKEDITRSLNLLQ